MKMSALILPAMLALGMTPAYAQCGRGHSSHGGNGRGQDHSTHQESEPKVRATNTICPVTGEAVKPSRDREVVIRGKSYLICCAGCGPALAEDSNKYLDQEGRPLNDPTRGPKGGSRDSDRPAPAPSAHEGH